MSTFNKFLAVALLLGLSPFLLAEELSPRMAFVNFNSLLENHKDVQKFREELNADRKDLRKESNSRLERVREIRTEVESLRKQLEDESVSFDRKGELRKEVNEKVSEGISLEKEHREYVMRRKQAVNAKVVRRMKSITDGIKQLINTYAKENGYDYVIDKSALSVASIPVILYSKDALDITKPLIEKLPK